MKLSNPFEKQRERLLQRWSEEDYPGGTPRFQLSLLAKDVVVFCFIPVGAILIFKVAEVSFSSTANPKKADRTEKLADPSEKNSQIIHFQARVTGQARSAFSKRAPGSLVRVRLLNVVETYATASVHAQIVDAGLGREFVGGTLIGDASSESSTGRIQISFRFARPPKRLDLAVPIAARAMSLDGTVGVTGTKKEGIFARAAIRSASSNPNTVDAGADNQDFKTLVARAVAAGLMQEFQTEAGTAYNQAQVLTLKPMTEFFVELTDYFPGQK